MTHRPEDESERWGRARTALIAIAIAISLLAGLGSLLSELGFSGNESMLAWVAIDLPILLCVAAVVSWKYPHRGLALFLGILLVSTGLCAYLSLHSRYVWDWASCVSTLWLGFIAGGVLVVNSVVAEVRAGPRRGPPVDRG